MKKHLALMTWLLAATAVVAADLPPGMLAESKRGDVGYKTVAAAMAALKQSKDAAFSTVRGWTIVTDEAHLTVWSFAPKTDPSYPSVVKRMVTSGGSGSSVSLQILCESDKVSCDNLVREFNSRGHGGN